MYSVTHSLAITVQARFSLLFILHLSLLSNVGFNRSFNPLDCGQFMQVLCLFCQFL